MQYIYLFDNNIALFTIRYNYDKVCCTVQHSIHRHICRYVSKSYYNMKGHGIYSVNTLHIHVPCSPPFYQIPYLQNTKY